MITKQVIILNAENSEVYLVKIESDKDIEEAVSGKLEELELNESDCTWMELPLKFTTIDNIRDGKHT